MALLALYWSIMIVFYLLASRLRPYAARMGFLGALTNLSVYALVFLMGLRMGANREVTSSLASIGVQALLVTVLTVAGSMLAASLTRRALGLDHFARPRGSAPDTVRTTAAKADSAGAKTSLTILAMVAVGMLLGYLAVPRLCTDLDAFQSASGDWLVVGLCILLALVGTSMGLEGKLRTMLRGAGASIILVPLASVVGSLAAGAVYALVSPMSLREGLAISAGFGWYTMAPGVISGAGHAVAGAVSFLHNVMREVLGIVCLPLAAAKFGSIEAVTIPGTAAMDVCLPIVERSCSAETLPYSFMTGMASCLFSALLVPLIMSV